MPDQSPGLSTTPAQIPMVIFFMYLYLMEVCLYHFTFLDSNTDDSKERFRGFTSDLVKIVQKYNLDVSEIFSKEVNGEYKSYPLPICWYSHALGKPWNVYPPLLLLFRHNAKRLNTQEQRLANSP